MTDVFKTTAKPILVLCQFFGLIDMCYAFESTGPLLVRYTNSVCLKSLELTRTIALLACTYAAYKSEFYYSQKLDLLKFWVPVIVARASEVWMIKLVNGIVEFDRKSASVRLDAGPPQQLPREERRWNATILVVFAYWTGLKVYCLFLWPPKRTDVTVAVCYLFMGPSIMEMTVAITACFFLFALDRRYQLLNDIVCTGLPAGLVAVPGRWTHTRIAEALERVRLLHAELSELLTTFGLCCGPLLLGFFVFSFVRVLYYCLFSIKIAFSLPGLSHTGNFLRNLPLYVVNVQNTVSMTFIIVLSSRITDKTIGGNVELFDGDEINRAGHERFEILILKLFVNIFMSQISFFETNEITAYGFFNINSNLLISLIVLLITGFATLLQMRDHQIVLRLVNNSTSTAESSFHNIKVT